MDILRLARACPAEKYFRTGPFTAKIPDWSDKYKRAPAIFYKNFERKGM